MKRSIRRISLAIALLLSALLMILGGTALLTAHAEEGTNESAQTHQGDFYSLTYDDTDLSVGLLVDADVLDYSRSTNFRELGSTLKSVLTDLFVKGIMRSTLPAPHAGIRRLALPEGIDVGGLTREDIEAYIREHLSNEEELNKYIAGDYDMLMEQAADAYKNAGMGTYEEFRDEVKGYLNEAVENLEMDEAAKEELRQQLSDTTNQIVDGVIENGGAPSFGIGEIIEHLNGVTVDGTRIFSEEGVLLSGVKALLRELPRPAELVNYTPEQLEDLLSYTVGVETDFGDFTFKASFGIYGDTSYLKAALRYADKYIDVTRTNGVPTAIVTLPAQVSEQLLRFLGTQQLKEKTKELLVSLLTKDGTVGSYSFEDAKYVFDDLLDFFSKPENEHYLAGLFRDDEEMLRLARKVIDKLKNDEEFYNKCMRKAETLFDQIPGRVLDKSALSFYQGEGSFSYQGTVEVEAVIDKALSVLDSIGIDVRKYVKLAEEYVDVDRSVEFRVELHATDIYKITYLDQYQKSVCEMLLPVGANIADFSGHEFEAEGNYWADVEDTAEQPAVVEVMPAHDITVYEYSKTVTIDLSESEWQGVNGLTVEYDGKSHSDEVSLTGAEAYEELIEYVWTKENGDPLDDGKAIEVGTYHVGVQLKADVDPEKYILIKPAEETCTFTIEKAVIDLGECEWVGDAVEYDGEDHVGEVSLKDLPAETEALIKYVWTKENGEPLDDGKAIEVGKYLVSVQLKTEAEAHYRLVAPAAYTFEITKILIDLSGSDYEWVGESAQYNGKDHVEEVSLAGAEAYEELIEYVWTKENGEPLDDGMAIEVGKYIVSVQLKTEAEAHYKLIPPAAYTFVIDRCELDYGSYGWKDIRGKATLGSDGNFSLVYDGEDHIGDICVGGIEDEEELARIAVIWEKDGVRVTEVKEAGVYTIAGIEVKAEYEDHYKLAEDGSPAPCTFTIISSVTEIDLDGITWQGPASVAYDGNEHIGDVTLDLSALAEEVREVLAFTWTKGGTPVTTVKEVGVYSVSLTLTDSENYVLKNAPAARTFEITKAEIDLSAFEEWENNSPVVYDRQDHVGEVTLKDLPAETAALIEYVWQKDGTAVTEAKAVGQYTVGVKPKDEAHYTVIGVTPTTFEITALQVDVSELSWNYTAPFTYDGQPHTVEIKDLPAYLTVTYEGQTATEVGTYTAVATFALTDTTNYAFKDGKNTLSKEWQIVAAGGGDTEDTEIVKVGIDLMIYDEYGTYLGVEGLAEEIASSDFAAYEKLLNTLRKGMEGRLGVAYDIVFKDAEGNDLHEPGKLRVYIRVPDAFASSTPETLVIVHYPTDGGVESIEYTIETKDGFRYLVFDAEQFSVYGVAELFTPVGASLWWMWVLIALIIALLVATIVLLVLLLKKKPVSEPVEPPTAEETVAEEAPVEEPTEETVEEAPAEEPVEEVPEEEPVEEPVEEVPEEEPVEEEPVEEVAEEAPVEEPVEEVPEEEPVEEPAEEVPEEEPVEEPVEEVPEEEPVEEPVEEVPEEEPVEEEPVEEVPEEEPVEEPVEEVPVIIVPEELAEEEPAEEVPEEEPAEEVPEEEPVEEVPAEEEPEEAPEKVKPVVILPVKGGADEPIPYDRLADEPIPYDMLPPEDENAPKIPAFIAVESKEENMKEQSAELAAAREDVIYDRSFTARIAQADETVRTYYNQLKAALLAYRGVKSRISWTADSFNTGRTKLAKLQIKGKTLVLYLALDPKEVPAMYRVQDASSVAKYATVPTKIRLRNTLAFKHAKELIAELMEKNGIPKTARPRAIPQISEQTTEQLIEEGFIKCKKGTRPTFWGKSGE